MRNFLVAGNWKMHGSQAMTTELISGLAKELGLNASAQLPYEVLLCPAAPYLVLAQSELNDLPFKLGAQNVNQNDKGAFTGEMSVAMLHDIGCQYTLVGHSERREIYHENDQQIAEKFLACINNNQPISPVLCVGETLEERQADETEAVIQRQIETVINKVGIAGFENAVIAYEPVWAIGTGETATPKQAQAVHVFIRELLANNSKEIADKMQILYGGSVKPTNALELFSEPDIDGGLIGGASLDAQSFAGICKAAESLSK